MMRYPTRHEIFSLGAIALAAASVIAFSFGAEPQHRVHNTPKAAVREIQITPDSVDAQAVLVADLASGKTLYAHNADAQLPLASLTKLMTAHTAWRYGGGDMTIRIPYEAVAVEGDSGLNPDAAWTLSSLIDVTLTASVNDAAAAIASESLQTHATTTPYAVRRQAFVARMNNEADRIGMAQTFFLNPSGLDTNAHISGGYGSARDIVLLLEEILIQEPRILAATRRDSLSLVRPNDRLYEVKNTNEYLADVPGLVASKTGFTDLAGGNLAVVFEPAPAHPIAVVVLGSTKEGRFLGVESLVKKTIDKFSK